MKVLVDEIHAMGLKAGIYSSSGTHTCGLQFGSLDYEEIDAETYAFVSSLPRPPFPTADLESFQQRLGV